MTKTIATISKTKLAKLATITLSCEPEQEQIEGNASAVDRVTDNETNAYIRDQLNRGNEWAWCTITVTASYDGLEASNSLGCCSYDSERAFRRDGYFRDLRNEALAGLREKLVERDRELPLRQVEPAVEVSISWRQAIVTKYSGNSRISVRAQAGMIVVHWDHALNAEGNHAAAARQFAERYAWTTGDPWVGAAMPDGKSYCFVQVPKAE